MDKKLVFTEILAKAEPTLHKLWVPELDGYIEYCDLTLEDFSEIYNAKSSPVELSKKVVFKAWSKADPNVTMEGISKKIPLKIILKIVNQIVGDVFLTGPLGTSPAAQSEEPSTS